VTCSTRSIQILASAERRKRSGEAGYARAAAVRFQYVRSHRADTHLGNNIADGLAGEDQVRKEQHLSERDTAVSENSVDTILHGLRNAF
jgi:hypothetical protein